MTIAGTVSAGCSRAARSTTRVDSAPPGSQAELSFCSTSPSRPASMRAGTSTATQTATTTHLVYTFMVPVLSVDAGELVGVGHDVDAAHQAPVRGEVEIDDRVWVAPGEQQGRRFAIDAAVHDIEPRPGPEPERGDEAGALLAALPRPAAAPPPPPPP